MLTDKIRAKATALGFDDMGVAAASRLNEHEKGLEKWLENGFQAGMDYMTNHFDKRLDPSELVPGTKSVIVLTYNYYPVKSLHPNSYKVSKYAYGRDYHKVLKKKLKALYRYIESLEPSVEGRFFVDSAPVMERQWAEKAGLGWRGKNSLLINKKKGSFFFISELLLNLELECNESIPTNHCGSCTKCIDACPTDAIVKDGVIDANKCISYLTIENKGEIRKDFQGKMEGWVFGCDICQDVCPWNRFSISHSEKEFDLKDELLQLDKERWEMLNESEFNSIFTGSAVKRTGYEGLMRNIKAQ